MPTLHLAYLPVTVIPSAVAGDYHEYFFRYLHLVPPHSAGRMMVEQLDEMQTIWGSLTEERSTQVTPPWTWSLRQVLGHLCDVERVFGYRAARLASNDATPLPGFDQNIMVDGLQYNTVLVSSLLQEWLCLRWSNILFFAHLQPAQYALRGNVDGHPMTVAAAAGVIAGHIEHHLRVVRHRVA